MKNRILFLILILLPLKISAQGGNGGQDAVNQAYERVVELARSTSSLVADFTETKNIALLSEPVVKRGRLYFRSPSQMRWEYDKENYGVCNAKTGYMVVDGRKNNGASRAFAQSGKMITSFMSGTPVDSRRFAVNCHMAGNHLIVELTPSGERLKGLFDHILMCFDAKSSEIEYYEVKGGGGTTTVQFSNIQRGVHIDDSLFE